VSYTKNYAPGGWQDEPTETTPINAAALQHIEDGIATAAATADAAAARLVPTAVKTGAYTAVPGDLVLADASAGSVTITLPAGPADGAAVAVKVTAIAGANTVTIARGGTTDTFNGAGSTSLTLRLLNQGVIAQYKASTGIWWVIADDLPLSQLDARYAQLGSSGIAGPLAPKVVTLTDAATIALDASQGNDFRVTLAGNRTLDAPAWSAPGTIPDGLTIFVTPTQDVTGSRTLAYDAVYNFGTVGPPTLTTTPDKSDILTFKYYASPGEWRYVGAQIAGF
jgi:hypothetical protein